MKRKLNCILLIDDNEADNFIHTLIIEEANCAEKVVSVQSGMEALDYLKSKKDGEYPHPDLIFLDINMPVMNGWEFLEEYEKLSKLQQGRVILMMLTTSLNPDDKEKARQKNIINGFKNKPLSIEMLEEVLTKYFADWV